MPTLRLTDGPAGNVWRKAPAGKTLEFYDTICPGLTLRIGPRGGSYLAVFKVKGSKHQFRRKIGRPRRRGEPSDMPGALTLPEARAAVRAMVADARAGITPEDRAGRAAAKATAAASAQAAQATLQSALVLALAIVATGVAGPRPGAEG
jgi:hypothetical protein